MKNKKEEEGKKGEAFLRKKRRSILQLERGWGGGGTVNRNIFTIQVLMYLFVMPSIFHTERESQ